LFSWKVDSFQCLARFATRVAFSRETQRKNASKDETKGRKVLKISCKSLEKTERSVEKIAVTDLFLYLPSLDPSRKSSAEACVRRGLKISHLFF